MDDNLALLKERLGRYKRVLGTEDATKTLDDIDGFFRLDESIFDILRTSMASGPKGESPVLNYNPHSKEWVLAKEGARAYSRFIRNLIETTESALKRAEEMQTKGESE